MLTITEASTAQAAPAAAFETQATAQSVEHFYWLTRAIPPAFALVLLLGLAESDMIGLMLVIQQWTRRLPDHFWSAATLVGHGSILLAFTVLAWKKRPDWIIACACGGVVAGLYSRLLKTWIGGPRPASVIPEDQLHIIGERLLHGSFPSGHTATAFLLAGVIFLSGRVPPRIAALALIAATLTGLSRIAVGAHWPVDVIAGAAGGWMAASIGIALMRQLRCLQAGKTHLLFAVLILGSSCSLLFVSTGYPLALPFQYLSAVLGMLIAGRWAEAEWQKLR